MTQLLTITYRFTDPSINSDKFYEMSMKPDDTFVARWGRWGSKGLTRIYPMSQWDEVQQNKIDKKYVEIDRKVETVVGSEFDSDEYELE